MLWWNLPAERIYAISIVLMSQTIFANLKMQVQKETYSSKKIIPHSFWNFD